MRIEIDPSRISFKKIEGDTVNSIYDDEFVKEQYRNDLFQHRFIDSPDVIYYGAFIDDDLAGMFFCLEMSPIERDVHLAFYKDYSIYSREICKAFISYLFSSGIYRITTMVMDYSRKNVNMALKIGFQYEGFMQKCTVRDGIWYGKHVLGIVR